jgi:hypothetical protein
MVNTLNLRKFDLFALNPSHVCLILGLSVGQNHPDSRDPGTSRRCTSSHYDRTSAVF